VIAGFGLTCRSRRVEIRTRGITCTLSSPVIFAFALLHITTPQSAQVAHLQDTFETGWYVKKRLGKAIFVASAPGHVEVPRGP